MEVRSIKLRISKYLENHVIYEYKEFMEYCGDIGLVMNWREGFVDDWVLSDDGKVLQVLYRNGVGRQTSVRTCVGTYLISGEMDTTPRENRFRYNGRRVRHKKSIGDRVYDKLSASEQEYADMLLCGMDRKEALKLVYGTNYVKKYELMTNKNIREYIGNMFNEILEDKGLGLDRLLKELSDSISTMTGRSKLSAIEMGLRLHDAFNNIRDEKIQIGNAVSGFIGFGKEELKRLGSGIELNEEDEISSD